VKVWKKIYQANGPPKQAGVAIHISDKVDFKTELVRRDKAGHFILTKCSAARGNNNHLLICTQRWFF
jgi:hypothetical protein